jgi:hypothetical protein
VRERSALQAWPAIDPTVQLVTVDTEVDGIRQRFEIARRVAETAPGSFHYEYAVRNVNSEIAARRLEIHFGGAVAVSGIGFKDVDHHSGEFEPDNGLPISTADWSPTFDGSSGVLSWETATFQAAPEANAIRWGTLYNFWFDADAGPDSIVSHRLIHFEPGGPCRTEFFVAPGLVFHDDFETGELCVWSASAV